MEENSRFQENSETRAGRIQDVSMKRSQNDQSRHRPECSNILDSADACRQFSVNYCSSLQFGSQSLGTYQPSTRNVIMTEELTIRNCNSLVGVSSSSWGKQFTSTTLCKNSDRVATGQRDRLEIEPAVDRNYGDIGREFQFPIEFDKVRGSENHSKVFEHVAENSSNILTSHSGMQSLDTIRAKMLLASGFQQFSEKDTLRGKVAAYTHLNTRDSHDPGGLAHNQSNEEPYVNLDSGPTQRCSEKEKGRSTLYGGGSGDIRASPSHIGGIKLREWLNYPCRNINNTERLFIFKQILQIVDMHHSHGYDLVHLRPSYFVILPSKQIKYIGSFVCNGRIVEVSGLIDRQSQEQGNYQLDKRRDVEQDTESQEDHIQKHQKLSHDSSIGVGYNTYPPRHDDQHNNQMQEDKVHSSMGRILGVDANRFMWDKQFGIPDIHNVSSSTSQILESMKLEEGWYANPEELNNNRCPFSSNIYSLGVLLFELCAHFETWELHCAAMLDLRHRILPPKFLSESPTEAGICLWLLHPDPSSRPKLRDILSSGLLCETKESPSPDDLLRIEEENEETDLLLNFLSSSNEHKENQAAKLRADLDFLEADILEVERKHEIRTKFLSNGKDFQRNIGDISNIQNDGNPMVHVKETSGLSNSFEERLMQNIEQLQDAYFCMKSRAEPSKASSSRRPDNDVLRNRERRHQVHNGTDERETVELAHTGIFFEDLCKFACYNRFEVRGIMANIDVLGTANVISSLSFDRDEDYFATAGVSRKIKIFEYDSLLNDNVDIHYPLVEMSNKSKLSSVCWNSYIKSYLASTDYEGIVQVWDASTGQGLKQFQEHQKRAWSVDFSYVDPTKLASGSDDCSAKLWSIKERNSIDTIRAVANVCCVQFSSHSSHLLAFGTANYKVLCYDLRHTRVPWCTLAGHDKAVSYIRFLDASTLTSASTDNTLRIWDLNRTDATGLSTDACSLTLSGHTNHKNFVGLSVSNGYISCGSETNDVFAYHKAFPMPITSYQFGSIDPITEKESSEANGHFVSSVCWREKSNVILAANSTGCIKALQLV